MMTLCEILNGCLSRDVAWPHQCFCSLVNDPHLFNRALLTPADMLPLVPNLTIERRIPLGYVFDSKVADNLLRLFPQPPYRNLALQCLAEVCISFSA